MIKKLTAIGNSLGIIIERPILELLDIDKDTPLDMTTDGEALVIRPVREHHRARVRKTAQRMMGIHDTTLKKLTE
jgi:antitoxin component of MazEF toxin-antitoxin module